jgi:hypothetical protein
MVFTHMRDLRLQGAPQQEATPDRGRTWNGEHPAEEMFNAVN